MRMLAGLTAAISMCVGAGPLSAEPVKFTAEGEGARTCRVATEVTTSGSVFTSGGKDKTITLQLTGAAKFAFLERRLPPAGRDAQSLRAVREFQQAWTDTTVGDRNTRVELPDEARLIVANGETSGVRNYCLEGPLTRESLDLLELPGDTLALSALLPPRAVEVGDEWSAPEWAAQMLGAVEAIESATVNCTLKSAAADAREVEIIGSVKGQRQGTNCEVGISGSYRYDPAAAIISGATLDYTIRSAVGVVSPGLDARVRVEMTRGVAANSGRLTEDVVKAVSVTPDEAALSLLFDATPWGLQLRHNRDWYLFHAVLQGSPQVAILRLIDRGSLIAQCNVSPIPRATPGQSTPMEQFEKDIRTSLGDHLTDIASREEIKAGQGMKVIRVVAQGNYTLKGTKGEQLSIPTHWIYYLCTSPNGRQASFVFSVESQLLEQLADKDLQLVRSLEFVADRGAAPVRSVERTSQAQP